jgi:hypothetical protein
MKFEFKDGLIWIPVSLEYEGKQILIDMIFNIRKE